MSSFANVAYPEDLSFYLGVALSFVSLLFGVFHVIRAWINRRKRRLDKLHPNSVAAVMGYNKDVIIFNAYIFAISIFYVAERFSDSTRNQNCCFQHAINILLYWIGNLLLARVYIQELYAADFAADYYYIRTGLWLVSLPTYVLLSFAFILPLVEVNGCSTRSVEGRDICYYSPDSTIASNFLELITGITLVVSTILLASFWYAFYGVWSSSNAVKNQKEPLLFKRLWTFVAGAVVLMATNGMQAVMVYTDGEQNIQNWVSFALNALLLNTIFVNVSWDLDYIFNVKAALRPKKKTTHSIYTPGYTPDILSHKRESSKSTKRTSGRISGPGNFEYGSSASKLSMSVIKLSNNHLDSIHKRYSAREKQTNPIIGGSMNSLPELQNKLPESRESAQRDSGGTQIIPAPIVSLVRHDSKHSVSSLIWPPGTAGHREPGPSYGAGMITNMAGKRKNDSVPVNSNLSNGVTGGSAVVHPKNNPDNFIPSTRNAYLNYDGKSQGNTTAKSQKDMIELKKQMNSNASIEAHEPGAIFVPNPLSDPIQQPPRSPKHRTTYSASSIKIHSTPIDPHIAANPVNRQDFIRKSCDLQRELKLKIQERFGGERYHPEDLLTAVINVDDVKHDSLPSDGKHDDYLAID